MQEEDCVGRGGGLGKQDHRLVVGVSLRNEEGCLLFPTGTKKRCRGEGRRHQGTVGTGGELRSDGHDFLRFLRKTK